MKPCWEHAGLTKAGAEHADKLIDEWVRLVSKTPQTIIDTMMREAMFRRYELPLHTMQYQRKYLRENGARPDPKGGAK